jgi:mediator of RNA polymerase II transcription subunit 18, fungi type
MQEILLFGQVPAENHTTLRQQLAGVTRMQPQPVVERHLIFRPIPPAGLTNLPTGSGQPGSQQQELQKTRQLLNAPLNYVQLVGVVENGSSDPRLEGQKRQQNGSSDGDVSKAEGTDSLREGQRETLRWYLEWRDIPEPGKVTTTSRAMSRTRFIEGDPIQFVKDLGYE